MFARKRKKRRKFLLVVVVYSIAQMNVFGFFVNDSVFAESKLDTNAEEMGQLPQNQEQEKIQGDSQPDIETIDTNVAEIGNSPENQKQVTPQGNLRANDLGTIESVFPDPGLAQIVAKALEKQVTDKVTDEELGTKIISLSAQSQNIKDLTGVEKLTSLTYLKLGANQISDVSPLSGLTSLTNLELGANQISDVSPLSGLTSLTYLVLGSNQISDVSPLSGLTSLTNLELEVNQISDVSPLSGLTSLTYLKLGANQISDVSPLSGLTSLTNLYLRANQISDVSPLSGLTSLTYLELHNNQISDISPLSSLKEWRQGDAKNQSIQLEEGQVGKPTLFTLLDKDSQVPDTDLTAEKGTFANGQVIWQTAGDHSFTWASGDGTFTGTVKQTVVGTLGTLSFSDPGSITVGDKLKISPKDEQYKLHFEENHKLSVQDTRDVKSQWKLTASVVSPLQNSNGQVLPDAIHYRLNSQEVALNDSATLIYQNQNRDEEPFDISDTWDGTDDGLYLDIKEGEAKVGTYEATIRWVLEDTPGNVGEEERN
ncbi:leucine-rich repeat domain-containing protein [Bacillus cereus group sp. BfR-BA-01427]|uniref:leucine-rich repeat domain-containing protein n=1 Tax=Bacillus cereus group sp. BfR-BA-01427 TaxID=2920344 RepID=UPI001F5AA121